MGTAARRRPPAQRGEPTWRTSPLHLGCSVTSSPQACRTASSVCRGRATGEKQTLPPMSAREAPGRGDSAEARTAARGLPASAQRRKGSRRAALQHDGPRPRHRVRSIITLPEMSSSRPTDRPSPVEFTQGRDQPGRRDGHVLHAACRCGSGSCRWAATTGRRGRSSSRSTLGRDGRVLAKLPQLLCSRRELYAPTMSTSVWMSPRKRLPYHHGDLRNAPIDAGLILVEQVGVEAFSLRQVACARDRRVANAGVPALPEDKGALDGDRGERLP